MRKFSAVSVLLLSVLLVAACGSSAGSTPAASPPVAGSRVVTHALGTTEVPAEPKRVVALGFIDEDMLTLLGVKPVGYVGYQRKGLFPWQEGRADLTGAVDLDRSTNEAAAIDMEQLADLRPDLILGVGYWQIDDEYQQLSAIAPTVGPPTRVGVDSWQDNSRLIGEALGQQAATEVAISAAQDRVSAVAAEFPNLKGKTYVSAHYWGENDLIVAANPKGSFPQLLGMLGLQLSPRLAAEIDPQQQSVGAQQLSMERLDLLEADLLLLGHGDKALRQQLDANRSYLGLQVVRDGRVAVLERDASAGSNNLTPLNAPWLIDQVRPTLAKVSATG